MGFMQDRYVGDIGDYVKLAILRAIMPESRLGVAWWRYPNESHNSDGRHTGYLGQPGLWRSLDPDLFDQLKDIVTLGDRRVEALQRADMLPGAIHFDEPISVLGAPVQRAAARDRWFSRVLSAVDGCDLVFLDPDNGLETKNFDAGARKAGKSVCLAELQALGNHGRTLIVYHHQTRMAGGHQHELAHWGERLKGEGFHTVDALRASAYSARAFFLLNGTPKIRSRAEQIATKWGERRLTWHPKLGSTV